GVDVAVDLAAHHDRLRADVAVDDGAVPEGQGAIGVDFAVQFAVKGKFAGELDVAFDFNVGVQHVFGGVGCVHSVHLFSFVSLELYLTQKDKGVKNLFLLASTFRPQPGQSHRRHARVWSAAVFCRVNK